MNTFFREDIPDSVGDTFLIETNRPYHILLCAATSTQGRLRLPLNINPRTGIPGQKYPCRDAILQNIILPLFLGTSNIYVILKNH